MRIGIDAHVLGKKAGGVERFVRELVQRLPQQAPEHDYVVFVTKKQFASLRAQTSIHPRLHYVPLAFAHPLLERLFLLPWLVYRYQLQALMVQRLAPWFCGACQLVVVIHDLTPIKYPTAYKGISNRLVRLLTRNTIRRAAMILTPTLAIKTEIKRYCPSVKAPIHAFYNGVDSLAFSHAVAKSASSSAATSASWATPASAATPASSYLLTVGAIERRKNLETLHAMVQLLKSKPTLELVVVGGVRDQAYYDELQMQLVQMGLTHRVKYYGFMAEDALISMYQHATVFISASKDEGFNIPPLEAMACGIPVVCSDIAVHQELFAGAARFYETCSADALKKCVELVLDNNEVRQSMVTGGYLKIAQYTWQNTAKNVATAFSCLGGH